MRGDAGLTATGARVIASANVETYWGFVTKEHLRWSRESSRA